MVARTQPPHHNTPGSQHGSMTEGGVSLSASPFHMEVHHQFPIGLLVGRIWPISKEASGTFLFDLMAGTALSTSGVLTLFIVVTSL